MHQPQTSASRRTEPTPAGEPPAGLFARSSVARIVPFAVYMAFVAIADLFHRLGWTADELRWLYPVKIGAVLLALFVYRRDYTELAWRPMRPASLAAAVLVGVVVLVLWVRLDAPWMLVGTSAGFDPTNEAGQIDWLLVAVRIAGAALVVPVMEELFWRSFLMRWISDRLFLNVTPARVGMTALVATSVLFGVEHNQWFAGVVAGLAYGVLYMRTGNIWAPIVAHAVTNALLGAWIVGTGTWTYW